MGGGLESVMGRDDGDKDEADDGDTVEVMEGVTEGVAEDGFSIK